MAEGKVLFELELRQKGDKVQIVQKQTEKLANSTEKLDKKRKKLTKTTDAYNRREKGAAQISSNSTKNFSKMAQGIDGGGGSGGLVRAYALLAANVFALSAAFGILSRSAQIDTLVESMQRLEVVSGNSIRGVARDLQEASGFGLDFAESMRAVSLATSAGFGGDKIVELGNVARNAAVSLGRNLPDALDRIFRGVIKVEPELLDEIGLFVRVNDASAKYAAELKKSVGDLTEFEKRQAFLNEALEQGGKKFEAFQDVENDAFALLATTFTDISHAAISFVNKGITPIVRMLAENKVLFSTVFAALGIALLKLAVPAMAAFTQSLANNAVQQATNAAAAKKDAELRAGMAKKENLEFLAQQKKKQEELAKTAMAQTQAGPQGKLSVRGKKQSAGLEQALSKELNVKTRMQLVDQRIADIENNRGKTQRLKNADVQAELAALKEERRIHAEITSLESQQAAARQADVASGKGSVVRMTQERAYAASLRATSLATVANQAQSLGLAAAYRQIGVELNKTSAATAFGTGVFGAFRKTLFVTKAAAVSTGIAFQGMWMKIMGPFSIFLLLLPLFMKFNKMLGVGSEEAEKLSKASKSASEAMELLPKRIAHVNEQLAKQNVDIVSVNKGMETFKNTIYSTITAIADQEEAFNTYLNEASGWARFWGETFPSIFGGGTANAIEDNKKQLIDSLKETDIEVSAEMAGLLATLEKLETEKSRKGPNNSGALVRTASDEEIEEQTNKIIERAKNEADAFKTVRSAIDGAKDSAREFSNSMITKTQADGPLASFRQLETSLADSFLTEKERSNQLKEISQDSAVLAMLTENERIALNDVTKTETERLAVITQVKDRYFEQQESIIQSKTELKEIQQIQKSINGLLKESTASIEQNFSLEQRRREIEEEQVGFTKTNALSQSNLTEERIRQLMAVKDIRTALTDEEKELTDIKSVQSAITALTEDDIVKFKNRIALATETERKEKMIAEAKLAGLKRTEKTNKLEAERVQITRDIAAFQGGMSGSRSESINKQIQSELTAQKTRKDIIEQEKTIAKLNFDILAKEARQMAKEVGVESTRGKQYIANAKVLEAAGVQVAADIEKAAKNAAKSLGLSLVNAFKGFSGGAGSGTTDMIGALKALTDFASSDANLVDGEEIITESMKAAAGVNALEESLVRTGEQATALLGEDGALVAAMANFSAGMMDSVQNINFVMKEFGDSTEMMVSAVASAMATTIANLAAAINAQAQAGVKGIDEMINAEKNRDGKSKESLAKMATLEKKKEAMQKKAFETNKKLMIAQAIASTAAGVAGALAIHSLYEVPFALVAAGLIAAMGAAQVAIISGLTYQSSNAPSTSVPSSIEVGKRDNSVDTSRGATGGELAFLRGQQGVGSNANNFTPGGAAGMKRGYASGGEILVGERGPEIVQPTTEGFNVVPNDKIGGTTNVNFSINAVDAAGVEDLLTAQRGNIIGMIREAANEHGQEFMEEVNTGAY